MTESEKEAEYQRARKAEHETKIAAQKMQRSLLDEIEKLKAENAALTAQIAALSTKEHGWAWALEQLAAGKKVTHDIISHPDLAGWIEKIGDGPQGPIYEVHDGYCWSRLMTSDGGWKELVHHAKTSTGWRVL